MDVGVITDVTEYTAPIADLAQAVEQGGLEALFVTQHTHVPSSRIDLRDDPFHRADAHLLDPFVALAVAAASTTRITLGTGICLAAQYDPIILAKQVATLDFLSGGRLVFGVGPGWLEEEMQNHHLEPRTRWRALRETVVAMQRIWTHDEATFHGQFVDFEPIWMWPKPRQKPYPPILVGGGGPTSLALVVDVADGWIPMIQSTAELEQQIEALESVRRDAGKPPIEITAVVLDIDEPLIERCASLGVRRCLVWLPATGLKEVKPVLERCSQVADRLRTWPRSSD